MSVVVVGSTVEQRSPLELAPGGMGEITEGPATGKVVQRMDQDCPVEFFVVGGRAFWLKGAPVDNLPSIRLIAPGEHLETN